MAAALIVPAGVATAQHVGAATGPDNVTCTTNTGGIKFSPGVSLTKQHGLDVTNQGRNLNAKPATLGVGGVLDNCTGVGITDSTSGALYFSLRLAPVNCKTIKGKTAIGSGQIKWASDGSNAGLSTKLKFRIKWNSLTQIQFGGTVASTDQHTYLHGGKIRGTATIPPALRSAGDNGGTCSNSAAARVKHVAWTQNSDFTINVDPS